jgi:hypothetical protein
MKYVDVSDLPPCSFSSECLRLIDDLEAPAVRPTFARLSYINDFQDERRLRQIRSHLSGCATCSALLAEARRTRTQQRMTLYYLLLANEQQVPATTDSIFAALRSEQAHTADAGAQTHFLCHKESLDSPALSQEKSAGLFPLPFPTRNSSRHNLFRNLVALLTVVAVILSAVGLLNYFSGQSAPVTERSPLPRQPEQPGYEVGDTGWHSVIVGLTFLSATGLAEGFTIYSFDTTDDLMTSLISSHQEVSNMDVEGVSSNGQSLLYAVTSPLHQRVYTTFSLTSRLHNLYALNSKQAGNAVWMDSAHVLVQNTQGSVFELDASTGAFLQSWSVQANQLLFYHQPFLYFIGAGKLNASSLYRVDLSQSDAVAQQITGSAPDTRFWLSPNGTTVAYERRNSSGAESIATVSSNGTPVSGLSDSSATPIGYAADDTLMGVQQRGKTLQVMELGATSQQKSQVLLANAAPGATSLCGPSLSVVIISICDQNIALDPFGHGLFLHAYYANGTNALVYDNLETGTSQQVWTLPGRSSVQLPGWSEMVVGADLTATPSPVHTTSQVAPESLLSLCA